MAAKDAYKSRKKEVNTRLSNLNELLKKHEESFEKDNETDLRFVGDIGYVIEVLFELEIFLKDAIK
jgi:hypothetical protein